MFIYILKVFLAKMPPTFYSQNPQDKKALRPLVIKKQFEAGLG
jgi:hypothetical protein